jgi:transcriptional regulator with XRE-family HTH domain
MRKLRAARGLSQEAPAPETGVNRTYLSSVERAERNRSIDNVARIAKALEEVGYAFGRPSLWVTF